MTYTKPTIEVLDKAVRVIQGPKSGSPSDGQFPNSQATQPAYDLDD